MKDASLLGDPSMLRQLVNIYLLNAIKFTSIGGNVMLRATPEACSRCESRW